MKPKAWKSNTFILSGSSFRFEPFWYRLLLKKLRSDKGLRHVWLSYIYPFLDSFCSMSVKLTTNVLQLWLVKNFVKRWRFTVSKTIFNFLQAKVGVNARNVSKRCWRVLIGETVVRSSAKRRPGASKVWQLNTYFSICINILSHLSGNNSLPLSQPVMGSPYRIRNYWVAVARVLKKVSITNCVSDWTWNNPW